jgi:tight adherence protein C
MTALVAWTWALLVFAGFLRHEPAPGRIDTLVPATSRRGPLLSPVARRWAPAVSAALATAFVIPPLAPVALILVWGAPVLRARRRRARGRDDIRRSLPELVDLFVLTVGSGMTVPLAIDAVARRHVGPAAAELRRVTEDMARGQRCADALDAAAERLGPDVRGLFAALASSDRHGAPLTDALLRIAGDVRADRRRRAEEAARRIPVRLLFPLVLCVLPAFALLTVAPLLAGALQSLRL